MKKIYAQIDKRFMEVDLIGGEEVALPIDDSRVYCIDITDGDDIHVGMLYDANEDTFSEKPTVVIAASELREQAYLSERYQQGGITPLITYEGKDLTVEECRLELELYTYDSSEKADGIRKDLTTQYNSAKAYIRQLYPNEPSEL